MEKLHSYTTEWSLNSKSKECVVLLHGLFRNQNSMSRIAEALSARGYSVVNFGYDSRSKSIDDISVDLHNELRKLPAGIKNINFVTHSLGSIIVRHYLSRFELKKARRFVMIAPPNQGSAWGNFLRKYLPFAGLFFGKTFQEIESVVKGGLKLPCCEFGVIAGGTGGRIGLNPFIPGDNDMTVGVNETKLEGMKDFIVLTGQHSMMLYQDRVIENVINFLKTGRFLH